ncbi:MAG: hypothetical protein HN712_28415, partial [Gemmatimonadetes bacterium]|nr:hypothetical protein [Gemmatimonadota bacterium]
IYFQPDLSLYADTAIRPRVADLVQHGNPMARLADQTQRVGLDFISWTVCLHNSDLAQKYPSLAQQTAYGDRLGWILCPGEEDVRAYVVAICRDLVANYGVKRLELETCNFGGYGHHHHHPKDGVPLGNVGRYLYSLSFSDGCRSRGQKLGIDVDRLASWVRMQLDPIFRGGQPLEGDLEGFVAAHQELADYQQMREETVSSLVTDIRRACPDTQISFLLMGDRWTSGIRADQLQRDADRMGILAYTASPDEAQGMIEKAMDRGVPSVDRLVTGLCAYPPASPDAQTLAAVMARARSLNVEEFSFYNYGIMPEACLEWVSSCIQGTSDS